MLPLHPPVERIRNHTVWIFHLHKSVNTVLFEADFSYGLALLILIFHLVNCLNHSLSPQLAAFTSNFLSLPRSFLKVDHKYSNFQLNLKRLTGSFFVMKTREKRTAEVATFNRERPKVSIRRLLLRAKGKPVLRCLPLRLSALFAVKIKLRNQASTSDEEWGIMVKQ